jgi:DNA primase
MNRTHIETIKERLPVNEVIGAYVKLEKSGNTYKAKCPFHNEKSPSFFVSPDRGGYYCFGCGAKGDIFSFVEQFEGIDFKGALKILAEKAGVKLIYDKKTDSERDTLLAAVEAATEFFEKQIEEANPSSKEALAYVTKRGITEKTRVEFRIGWAPEGWSNLHNYLKKKGFSDHILEKAGLIKKKDSSNSPIPPPRGSYLTPTGASSSLQSPVSNLSSPISYYDRFRGRIMFPIFDSSGRVIAFSGRILHDDGKSAKYLNSPDTPLYDKSLVLYGLNKAKSEIRRMGYSILVEGQMDLVMSHQAGIKNTVASSGTALMAPPAAASQTTVNSTGSTLNPIENAARGNLDLIRRLSPNIILSFDSDKAGKAAAMRAVATTAISMGMAVKIANIEGGKDPADIVLENPEHWKEILRKAEHVVEFELKNVVTEVPDPYKRPRAIRERVFPFLARMESAMDKAHFVKMISDRAGISETAIWDDLKTVERTMKAESIKTNSTISSTNSTSTNKNPYPTDATPEKSASRIDLIERRMFGLLALMEKVPVSEVDTYRIQIQKIAGDSYASRIARIEPVLNDLMFEAEAFYGGDQAHWGGHIKDLITNFEENIITEDLISSMNELRAAEKVGNTEQVKELAKKAQVLSVRKAEVAKRKGT